MRARVIFLLAIVILLLPAFSGCAPVTPQVVEKVVKETVVVEREVAVEKTVVETVIVEKEKVKPKLTIWFANDMDPGADNWMEKLCYLYAVENDVDVTVYHDTGEVYFKKLSAAMETGALPDVWRYAEELLPGALKAKAIADVSDIVAELNTLGGGFTDGAIQAVTFDGKQWGIPYWTWADAWYIRKDLLDAKGLTPPTTFEEAAKVAVAVADPKNRIYGWGLHLGPESSDSNAEILTLIWSYGGSVWGKDGKTITLKSPETIKALELVRQVWKDGGMVPDGPNWDDYSNNLCYLTGACAMITNSGSVYAAMKANDPDLLAKTVIIPDPAGPAGRANYTYWAPWVMSSKTQNREEAKKFLLWLLKPDYQAEYMRFWNGQVFPIYKDLGKDPMWEDPYLKGFVDNSLYSHPGGWPGPNSLWAQEALKQHVLPAMVNRIVVEGWEPEKAVDEAVQKLETIYKSFQ